MNKKTIYIADNETNICRLTKPVLEKEGHNIVCISRRMDPGIAQAEHNRIISITNVTLNIDSRQAYINGESIGFTAMEFNLLSYLVNNRNRAVSRDELLNKVWGFKSSVETRATDDMVKRMRKKLAIACSRLKITTVWGYGFKIEAPDT